MTASLTPIDQIPLPPIPVDLKAKAALDQIVSGIPRERWRSAINHAPIVALPISSLTALQEYVRTWEVKAFAKDPDLRADGQGSGSRDEDGYANDYPIVIAWRGGRYIWDGHHGITAAIVRGDREVEARLVVVG